MKKACVLTSAIFLTLGLCTTTLADISGTAYLQNHGHTNEAATIWGNGYTNQGVYAGVYTWRNTSNTGDGRHVPNWGFCIDLPNNTANAWYDVVDLEDAPDHTPGYGAVPMGPDKAAYIQKLWAAHFDPKWPQLENKATAEVFAVCLWEIVYEEYKSNPLDYDIGSDNTGTVGDYTDGGFRATNVNTTLANQWLHSLANLTDRAPVFAVSNSTRQDFAVIPAPGAVLLGLLGLGLVGWIKRRFA